jgi:hypothetical protein
MYSAIARNKRNTWLILAGFIIVLGLIGLAAGWLAGNNWWISAFVLLGPPATRPCSISSPTAKPSRCRVRRR